ncbi:intracellular protein transport protein USO1 [Aristolochia californica]|uniref:intracellular protein transport protein USO1 n=1 Tax=Aristolochia californica TaxID=171875 RepID=UPI0035DCDDC6
MMDSQDELGSLFEGMVLIDPFHSSSSDDLPPPASSPAQTILDKEDDDPDPDPAQSQQSHSKPLDENLFSDLSLVHDPDTSESHSATPLPTTQPDTDGPSAISRQISRKKKRGLRIGYGREVAAASSSHQKLPPSQSDPSPPRTRQLYDNSNPYSSLVDTPADDSAKLPPSDLPEDPSSHQPDTSYPLKQPPLDLHPDSPSHHRDTSYPSKQPPLEPHLDSPSQHDIPPSPRASSPRSNLSDAPSKREEGNSSHLPIEDATRWPEEEINNDILEVKDCPVKPSELEHGGVSVEEELQLIKTHISKKLHQIREMAASVSAQRKDLAKKRRKAADKVNLASANYKQLEKELDESCEAEDFEKAEKVSEKLAMAEKEKEELLNELKETEADCDSIDSKLQEVLEMQIAAEEEAASLLKEFAKDAADRADLVLRNAEEFSSEEMKEWLSSTEALEAKKMELDIESQLIKEAQSGLKDLIKSSIKDETQEKEVLLSKRAVLTEELDRLLALVKLKEAEITENDENIEIIDKRITGMLSGFQEAQSTIDAKYDDLHAAISQLESESAALFLKKKQVDDYLSLEQDKRSKLKELASISINEAEKWQELVKLRRNLAASVLKSREDKVQLAKTEEKISEEVQILRQQVSAARTSLQELSTSRASIQQDIVSYKHKISFIDKRGPELEAEKKVAATARNFKEAGRIAAEAKALNLEKETIMINMDEATSKLAKVEADIQETIEELQKNEELILLKEREAALATCARLQLVAAAARAEGSAVHEIPDPEEAAVFLAEAEGAECEAAKLQETYGLEVEETRKMTKNFVSLALIANLTRKQLAEMTQHSRV